MPDYLEEVPKVACELLQQHREIRHLDLDLFFLLDHDKGDKHCRSRKAMHALFAGCQPSFFRLATLHLDRANLKDSKRDVVSALELGALKTLRLVQCKHTDKFLTALSSAIRESPMHLERLTIYHARRWDTDMDRRTTADVDPVIKALNTLLTSRIGSLHDLWICLRGFHQLPNTASVAHHGHTLKWLFLDVRKQKGLEAVMYPLRQWKILCGSLKALKQLDVACPPVVADGYIHRHSAFFDHVVSTAFLLCVYHQFLDCEGTRLPPYKAKTK